MKDKYKIESMGKGFVVLEAGEYTTDDLKRIIRAMERQADHAMTMMRDSLVVLNKEIKKNGEVL